MSGRYGAWGTLLRSASIATSAALLLVAFPATSEVPPATFTVGSTADAPDAVPGDGICASMASECTLRAAIAEAVATAAPSEIDVPAGHYLLASPVEIAAGALVIRGTDRTTTIIDAGGSGRAFDVLGGAALGLERVTITNGSATQEGGALRAFDAALSLDTVTVSLSATDGYGGGLFAAGSVVTITGTLFDQDTALEGGAVAVMGGDLMITGSTFTGGLATDAGGAVAAFAPHSLAITNTRFAGNTAEHSGGAVFLSGAAGPAPYAIVGSTFTGNQSFGGAGGAIAVDGLVSPGADGGLVVTDCSFIGNHADRQGGAIAAAVAITATGNQFMDNAAPENPDVALPVPSDLCRDAGICKGSVINAFRCYQTKPAAGALAFVPIIGVRLANAFGDLTVDLKQPRLLCAAAATSGVELRDAVTHLEGYVVKPQKGQAKLVPQTGLAMTSPIGTLVVDTAKADRLLLPTAADPAASPNLTVNQVDRFTCYRAKLAKKQPTLAKDLQLTVTDQLTGLAKRVTLKKLVRLCAPVGANGGDPKHTDHLLCFQVSATKGRCEESSPLNAGAGCKKEVDCGGTKSQTTHCKAQTKFAKKPGLYVANDLDAGRLDAAKEDMLCLPSRRLLWRTAVANGSTSPNVR